MTVKGTLRKYFPHELFFTKGLVRFSQPRALNDPFESRPELMFGKLAPEDYAVARIRAGKEGVTNIPDDELEALFMTPFPRRRYDESFPGLWPHHEPRLRDAPFKTIAEVDKCIAEKAITLYRDFADQNLGILSLTTSTDEIMWAYYADSHRGLAVEFREDHPYFARSKPVEYSDSPIYVSSNDGWVRIGGERVTSEAILSSSVTGVPEVLLFRKRLSWQHENELRLVRNLRESDLTLSPDPLGFPVHLFSIPPPAVEGVIFGYRTAADTIRIVREFLSENLAWAHVWVRQRVETADGISEVPLA